MPTIRKRIAISSVRRRSEAISLADQLFTEFRNRIPPNEAVIAQALRGALKGYRRDRNATKKRISRILTNAEARAYKHYRVAQQRAVTAALQNTFRPLVHRVSGTAALRFFAHKADALDAFFLKIAQGRKARAGRAVEVFFSELFRELNYPFERARLDDGTPDFVFPSEAHFRDLPTDCIVFTTKRTLRERWRQTTTEGARGPYFFLGTLDEKVSASALNLIKRHKIYLVVPERIRAKKFVSTPHVLSVEDFLKDHLDQHMRRWKRHGVLSALKPRTPLRARRQIRR